MLRHRLRRRLCACFHGHHKALTTQQQSASNIPSDYGPWSLYWAFAHVLALTSVAEWSSESPAQSHASSWAATPPCTLTFFQGGNTFASEFRRLMVQDTQQQLEELLQERDALQQQATAGHPPRAGTPGLLPPPSSTPTGAGAAGHSALRGVRFAAGTPGGSGVTPPTAPMRDVGAGASGGAAGASVRSTAPGSAGDQQGPADLASMAGLRREVARLERELGSARQLAHQRVRLQPLC